MNSVVIKPPYDVNSCQSKHGENSQAVEHVKKIVIFKAVQTFRNKQKHEFL